ncbi:MAG TPA: hypothetical protein VMB91_07515 [Solirubrobacteraceae bacterium]|nr:hypothetical protein [Solirubrobacteraceae bacterium]
MSTARALHPRALLAALAVSGVALAGAGVALAAKQVKGATYVGHYKGVTTEVSVQAISFKVSANGKKLTDLSVSTPFKCGGGCGGVGSPSGGTARITREGTFTVKLKIPAPGGGTEGTDTVTGTFHGHGKASGTVTSHFTHSSSGLTRAWTAVD